MFPNVRLMIVAILAAIAGIGCGLGLFATFRVNHEPLARLAEGSSPLQLAFDNRALGSDARAPLEARLPVDGGAKPISAPMIIAIPSPAPSPAPNPAPNPASSAGPSAVPSAVPQPSEADSSIAGSSGVQQELAGATARDHSNTASLALAVPAEQSSVTPETPGQQETAAALQDQQPAAAVPMSPTTEQTAAVDRCGRSTGGGETDKAGGEQSGKAGGESTTRGASASRRQGDSRPPSGGQGHAAAGLPIFAADLRTTDLHTTDLHTTDLHLG